MHIDIILPQFKKKSQEKVIPNLYKKKKKRKNLQKRRARESKHNKSHFSSQSAEKEKKF